MEIGLPLAGLGLIGKLISDRKNNKTDKKKVVTGKHRIPIQKNIYESNNLPKVKKYISAKAQKRTNASKNPEKTCIIPRMYNRRQDLDSYSNQSDSVFSDENSNATKESKTNMDAVNHMAIYNKMEKFKNNNLNESNNLKKHNEGFSFGGSMRGPSFLGQFDDMAFNNPGRPVAENSTEQTSGINGPAKQMENQRNQDMNAGFSSFEDNQDMTYGIIKDKERFVHNNMVPYFTSSKKGYGNTPDGESARVETNQRKLDLFTGSLNNIDYRPKTERRPLFNPIVGLSNIYGAPNYNDYFETRYIPGRERRGELPVQPIRDTPGLNLGYNQNKVGLNEEFRGLPRNIDDLRTASNRHVSYGSVVIPGMKGHKRAALPTVHKRRPETFKENNPRDMLKSLGSIRAHKVYGNYDAPYTNRDMHKISWTGPAANQGDKALPWERLAKYKKSFKEVFKHRGAGAPTRVGAQKATGNINAFNAKTTQRETTEKNNYIGGANNSFIKRPMQFDRTAPNTTIKDLTINDNRVGNVNNSFIKRPMQFDRTAPNVTMKDLTINDNRVGNVNNSFIKRPMQFDRTAPNTTIKDLTINNNRAGNVNNSFVKRPMQFDRSAPDTTMKDMTIQQNWIGGVNNSFKKEGPAFDRKNAIPDLTMKDTTIQQNWIGGVNNSFKKEGPAFHRENAIPDPTMKDITIQQNWIGGVNNSFKKEGPAFHRENAIPDPTMKDITVNQNWIGGANRSFVKAGHAFNFDTNKPDTTIKDMTIHQNWIGGANRSFVKAGHAFDFDTNIPDATIKDIAIQTNWVGPANHSFRKPGHSFNMEENRPDPTQRDTYIKNNYIAPQKFSHSKGAYDIEQQGTDAKTTHRQTYSKNNYVNPKKFSHSKGAYDIEQQNTNAKVTHRQTYSKNNYVNPRKFSHSKGAYDVEQQNTNAKVTHRQTYSKNNYVGPAKFSEKQRSRGDANNMLVNISKETVIKGAGRAPTTSNYNKGPTLDFSNVQVCEPIQLNRDLYPKMASMNMHNLPIAHTQIGNRILPQHEWRIDRHTTENLQGNPLINNTQHRAVTYNFGL